MALKALGIHHITAICSDAQRNLDFYAGKLGLRLVKRTVNFDDPATYHLYYGDGAGNPGTILTFFPWPATGKGRVGHSQVTAVSFAIPLEARTYWRERLRGLLIPFETSTRFGDEVLTFSDPDGLALELVASSATRSDRVNDKGMIPQDFAIRGLHSATLAELSHVQTALLLTETLGLTLLHQEANRFRYCVSTADPGAIVDILVAPETSRGKVAVGSVHHLAWRAADEAEQADWLTVLSSAGFNSSGVMDRVYFRSIYFREPGGILFEIATDPPGFTFDESIENLGLSIALPPWLEAERAEIEHGLPVLLLPDQTQSTKA